MCNRACYKFESCSAPLCPMDQESLDYGLWYADEDVCSAVAQFERPEWLNRQKRIAKLNTTGYFTAEMLAKEGVKASGGLKGLDPDRDHKPQLRSWLKNHGSKVPVQRVWAVETRGGERLAGVDESRTMPNPS